jgi:glutamate-1-semialdehyde 2,1-aminomutase
MSAGLAMLHYLNEHPEVYTRLDEIGQRLAGGFRDSAVKLGLNYTVNQIGSMFTLFMTDKPVTDLDSAKTSDIPRFGRYFHAMLDRGVYLAPAQYESLFLSTALTDNLIDQVIQANEDSLAATI